jgi:predicted DNA-binding mobile mystery protein A
MIKRLKQIQLINLDSRFEKLHFEPKPKSGWIKTIREALFMPLAFPASKLGISKQSIAQLEKNEIQESITLKSLRQLAESIGCELHYAIIPHSGSLKKIIEKRAEEKARAAVGEVNKTMALEDQKIKDPEASIKLLAKEYAEELNRNLWSNDEN